MTTIHLESRDILPCLRGSYTGNKFQIQVTTNVTIPMDAGLWSGGSRNNFHAVDMLTGAHYPVTFQHSDPWNVERRNATVTLQPGKAVVEHIMFQGKDLGLRIYLHPDNATKLLPANAELNELEHMVLNATASLKSSYGGRDRYQMTTDYMQNKPSREQWEAAKQSLIALGMLDKRGAITIKGKNARK